MIKKRSVAMSRAYMTVGEVAKRSGVAVSTLHYYESRGLIKSERSPGNQRRFLSVTLRYIAIIKVAQRAGISLEEIRKALAQFPVGSKLSGAQWKTLSLQWRNELDTCIQYLTRLRDELEGCIGCGCLSLQECPLRNPDDILGEQGPGPHILQRSE